MICSEISTYREAEEFILSIPKFSTKNSPEATRDFLVALGDISESIPTVHIAGTNGKGSVCALLRDALTEAGYTVGTFTSPHLVSLRERFMIGRKPISEEEFLDCFLYIYNRLREKPFAKTDYYPSYFEFLFFMAVRFFMTVSPAPDVLVFETGLGGRLDATNSLAKPVLSVITEIGFDHMEYLGDTIEKIAGEKAGIIKPGIPVVYADRDISGDVISARARELGSPCFGVSKNDITNLTLTTKGIDFSIESHYYENATLSVNSRAVYQAENAAIAFKALENLCDRGVFDVSLSDIKRGFYNMYWPGRMEEIEKNVFLDGAHNEDGIKAFLESVSKDRAITRHLVFSAVSDKQIEKITAMIIDAGLFDFIYIAPLKSGRAAGIARLTACFDRVSERVLTFESVQDAFEAMKKKKKPSETGYAAGSLYLVGEIKEVYDDQF